MIADGPSARDARVVAAYDAVTADYAASWPTSWTAGRSTPGCSAGSPTLAAGAPVVDVGCGPGHLTGFLAEAGADVSGLDLSPGMVAQARRDHPGLGFTVADQSRLLRPPAAPGWGAVVSWYSLIHLAGSELAPAVAALARVVGPAGWLAVAVHAGAAVHRVEEWWGHAVELDFVLHDPEQVRAAVAAAGLVVREWYARGPLPDEADAERLYLLAQRPGVMPQSLRCISRARSTSRKPSVLLDQAFIGALTPATTVKA